MWRESNHARRLRWQSVDHAGVDGDLDKFEVPDWFNASIASMRNDTRRTEDDERSEKATAVAKRASDLRHERIPGKRSRGYEAGSDGRDWSGSEDPSSKRRKGC